MLLLPCRTLCVQLTMAATTSVVLIWSRRTLQRSSARTRTATPWAATVGVPRAESWSVKQHCSTVQQELCCQGALCSQWTAWHLCHPQLPCSSGDDTTPSQDFKTCMEYRSSIPVTLLPSKLLQTFSPPPPRLPSPWAPHSCVLPAAGVPAIQPVPCVSEQLMLFNGLKVTGSGQNARGGP